MAMTDEPLFLDVHMRPHRSLTPRGFLILMAALGGMSFLTGMVFVLMGAWPVMGFFGLDVLIVYIAFKRNFRDAGLREILRVGVDQLELTRVTPGGNTSRWQFHPHWVRIRKDDDRGLVFASHGRELAVGNYLTDAERCSLLTAIHQALAKRSDFLLQR